MPLRKPKESPLMKRLKKKTGKGVLWVYILALLNDEERYAYEIRQLIRERFGFGIGNVTAYMVLYKLELGGYVKTKWRIKHGRQRKYYTITDKGRGVFDEGLRYLEDMTSRLSSTQ